MKKYVICLLLALVLVAGLLAVPSMTAHAEEEPHKHCACGASLTPGAKHVGDCNGEEIEFTTELSVSVTGASVAKGGNLVLTEDTEMTGPANFEAGVTVVICLNGHKLSGKDGATSRLFLLTSNRNITMNICDCSKAQSGEIKVSNTLSGSGAVFQVGTGNTVNQYGGEISGGTATSYGGIVYVLTGGIYNLHSGAIAGGTATNGGGNVYVTGSNAQFNQFGGTVSGGKANNGGNIYIAGGGKATLDGGTITKGNAGTNGGNVGVVSGTFELKKGTVSEGNAANLGGNIHAQPSSSTSAAVVMSGGKVTKGTAESTTLGSDNMIVINGATLEMSGGEITGGVRATGSGTNVTVSGTAVIFDDEGKTETNLSLNGTNLLKIGEDGLKEGAKIGVTLTVNGGVGTFAEGVTEDLSRYFVSDASLTVYWDEAESALKLMPHTHCICGGNYEGTGHDAHEDIPFTAWDGSQTSGDYYLTDDITLETLVSLSTNKTLRLCLNGHTITGAAGQRVFTVNDGCTLYITDCSKEHSGKIVANNATSTSGAIGVVGNSADGANVYIYGGTLTNNETTTGQGGVILVGNGSSRYGTLYIFSGTVTGGHAANGGNISVRKGSKLYLHSGAVIEKGTATANGGNIYIETGALAAEFNGATLSRGEAVYGGNVYANADVTIIGGTISWGKTVESLSGTVGHGGNIYLAGENAVHMLKGVTITNGSSGNIGGNVAIQNSNNLVTVTVDDCTITGGSSINGAGGVSVVGGKLILTGELDIRDNEKGARGDIHLGSGVTELVTMKNLSVKDNGTISFSIDAGSKDTDAGFAFADADADYTNLFTCYQAANTIWYENDQMWYGKALAQVGDTRYHAVQDALNVAEGKPVQLLTDVTGATLNVTDTAVIDLNGHDLVAEITGGGTVYGMDSGYDKGTFDASQCGTFTVISGKVAPIANVGNKDAANIYVAVKGEADSTYTFHYVNLKVYSLSLRPNYKNKSGETEPAMYFRTSIETDAAARETLLGSGGAYGAGLRKSEDKETPVLGNYKCSTFTFGEEYPFDDLKDNENKKVSHWGTLISGILTNEEAEVSVDTPIYCRAYITLGDETVFGNSAQMSLKELVQAVDNQKWTEIQRNELIKMYLQWESTMKDWGLINIKAAANG